MKNIILKLINSWKEKASIIVKRFPLSIIYSILFFIYAFWSINFSDRINIDNEARILFSLILLYISSIWWYLLSETIMLNNIKNYIIQFFIIIYFLIFYRYFIYDFESIKSAVYIFINIIFFITFILSAPFINSIYKKGANNLIIEKYFFDILKSIFLCIILGIAIFSSISLINFSFTYLFDIEIGDTENVYITIILFSFSIVSSLYFLSSIPEQKQIQIETKNENIFIDFIVKYIWSIFYILMTLILFWYTIKLLINIWDWPKWEVTWIVIIFSFISYLFYIFSIRLEEKFRYVYYIRKLIPITIFTQTFILFYAVYLRVEQYWLTINRYLIVLIWIFLFISSFYYIFSKKKNLIFIVLIISTLTISSYIWPQSVYNLPMLLQTKSLKEILKNENILIDWNIIIPEKDLEKEVSIKIYKKIDYLCSYHNCDSIKILFNELYKSLKEKDKNEWIKIRNKNIERYKQAIIDYQISDPERSRKNEIVLKREEKKIYKWPNNWEIINFLKKELKLKYTYENEYDYEDNYINIKIDKSDIFPINIEWYKKIIEIYNYGEWYNRWIFEPKDKKIILKDKDWKIYDEIDLTYYIDDIIKNNVNKSENIINPIFENEKYKVIFTNLELEKSTNYNIVWWYSNWYVLIKN